MTRNPRPSLRHFWVDLQSENAADEWRGSWAIAALYRRPGILAAYGASQIGATPLQITALGFLLVLSLPLQATVLPLGVAAWAVVVSACLFQILDCADGALARITGQTSRLGGDLDFLVDMAQWGFLYGSIGLLADRTLDGTFSWTALAVAAAWLRLMARVIRDRLNDPDTSAAVAPPPRIALKDLPILAIAGMSGLLPFLALTGDWLSWAVGFLLIYAVLDVLDALATLIRR